MKKRLFGTLLAVLCISFFAADSAVAAGRKRAKDPGGPTASAPQIISETRYIGPYFEIDSTGQTKHHIFLGEERLGILNDKQDLYFVISDHLGSSSILTTSIGTVAEMSDYKPFGSQTVDQAIVATRNQYTFVGKEVDPESSLQYFGARYLNNALAHFNSTDPLLFDPGRLNSLLADPQQLNSYAYSKNNPLSFFDPTGETVELVRRPIGGDSKVGAHAFVLITNTADDAAKLMDMPGVTDKTRITMGGYTSEKGWVKSAFGDLVKRVNDSYDYGLPEDKYLSRSTIQKPDVYGSQTAFENAVLQSYMNLPDNLRAYSFLAHPISTHQANSNNTASTVLLDAGVPQSQIVSGLNAFDLAQTPGLGVHVPSYSAPSAKTQLLIAKHFASNFFLSLSEKVTGLFR